MAETPKNITDHVDIGSADTEQPEAPAVGPSRARGGKQSRARARASAAGQPTVMTPERIEAICARIAKGMPISHAAAMEGVYRTTMDAALADRPEVRLAVDRAIAEHAEVRQREMLESEEGAKTRQWLLERLAPREYRPPPTTVEASGDLTGGLAAALAAAKDAARR